MGFLDQAGLSYLWGKVKAALGLKMDASVYDPTGKREDVFGYVDGTANEVFTEIMGHCVLLGRVTAALPVSANWPSVTYGDNKFVAVISNSGKSAYSTDGFTWTESAMPSSVWWTAIAHGNGKFVAVANGEAAYSDDGINWTSTTMPLPERVSSVAYGNGRFVAVAGGSTQVAYSLDGVTWMLGTMPDPSNWTSVAYGDGKFVAVCSNSTMAAYSPDGITWTASKLPSPLSWSCVSFGDGKFVVVANNNRTFVYSQDGVTWTGAVMPYLANWSSVIYGGGKFVAVSSVDARVAYSLDGIVWTAATLPSAYYWCSIAYGGDRFVAVASGSTQVAYSPDGITWYDGRFAYVDFDGNELTGFNPGPLTAADVGADPAGTAQGLVDALPVKKLVGTAEHPIDLDALTEPGKYYIEGVLVEKADPQWNFLKTYLPYGVPLDVMNASGEMIVQSVTMQSILCIRTADIDRQGIVQWSEFTELSLAVESRSVYATLVASAWTGTASPYTQSVSVEGIYFYTNGDIGLDQDATAEQRAAAREAMLCITGQGNGSITVTADGAKPTVDIPIAITILG